MRNLNMIRNAREDWYLKNFSPMGKEYIHIMYCLTLLLFSGDDKCNGGNEAYKLLLYNSFPPLNAYVFMKITFYFFTK